MPLSINTTGSLQVRFPSEKCSLSQWELGLLCVCSGSLGGTEVRWEGEGVEEGAEGGGSGKEIMHDDQ